MTDEKTSLRPSSSTMASVGFGIPVATIVAWAFSAFGGIEMPGPVQAAFGAVVSALFGYFFIGGKAAHTED